MKKNKKYILLILIILLLVLVFSIIQKNNIMNDENKDKENNIDENNKTAEEIEQEYLDNKEKLTIYQDNSTIEQLKEEYKITGKSELYQIETEEDGRKVINIKPNINYKVAFAGMIKGNLPNLQEIDSIFENSYPKQNGIWINENSREKIINYLNNSNEVNAKYSIDKDGYLQQKDENELTEVDKKIKKLINGSKQYIISISSKCYMVDVVTGEIIENRYNDLDCYQTYEYFEDENKMIIFLSENIEKKLNNDEIFESIIKLLEI